MKTRSLFLRGFEGSAFRPLLVRSMGQSGQFQTVDPVGLQSSMQASEQQNSAVQAWLQARPNYAQILSPPDLANWNTWYQDSQNLYGTVTNVESQVAAQIAQGPGAIQIDTGNYQTVQQWQQDISNLYTLTQNYPQTAPGQTVPAAAPAPLPGQTGGVVPIVQSAANALPGLFKPGQTPPKPVVAAPAGPSPLLIGGVAVVGIGILALVLRK